MNTLVRIGLGMLVFCLSGCSMIDDAEPPEFTVSNLQFDGVTVFETTATIDVRIDNPNPFPIELHGGVHRLYINDVYLGRGFDKDTITVDRLSTVTRPVPVHINNVALITKMQELVQRPELSYRIDSVLYRDQLGGRFEVEDSGTFRFDGIAHGGARHFSKIGPQLESKASQMR